MKKINYLMSVVLWESKTARIFIKKALADGHKVVLIFNEKVIPNDFPLESIPNEIIIQTIEVAKTKHFEAERRFITTREKDIELWKNTHGINGILMSELSLKNINPSASFSF